MKKMILFFSALAAVCSCTSPDMDETSEVQPSPVVLEAEIDYQTRTSMGQDEGTSRKVIWSEGDKILVAHGFRSSVFRTDEGGSSSTSFVHESGSAQINFEDGIMAAYPSDIYYIGTPDPDSEINITLPSEQKYVKDSFDDDIMPMLSDVSYDNHLTFRNIAGVIRLMISSGAGTLAVESVTLTADKPLCGSSWYLPSADTYSYDESGSAKGKNSVRLHADQPVEIGSVPVPFNVVVPHQEYNDLRIKVSLSDGTEQVSNMKDGKVLNVERNSILNIPLVIDSPVSSSDPTVNLSAGRVFLESFNVTFTFKNTESYFCGLVKASYFDMDEVLFSLDYLVPNNAVGKREASVTGIHSDFSEFQILPGGRYVFWIVPCNPEGIYGKSDIAYVEVETLRYQPGGTVSVTGLTDINIGTNSVQFDMSVYGYEKIFCLLATEDLLAGKDDQEMIDYLLDPENHNRFVYSKDNNITQFIQYNISSETDYVFLAVAVDKDGLYGSLFKHKISTPSLLYNNLKVKIDKDKTALPVVNWSVEGGTPAVYKYMFCSTEDYKWTGVFGSSVFNVQEKMFLESSLFYFDTAHSNTLTLDMVPGKEYVLVVSALTENANGKSSEVDSWIFTY